MIQIKALSPRGPDPAQLHFAKMLTGPEHGHIIIKQVEPAVGPQDAVTLITPEGKVAMVIVNGETIIVADAGGPGGPAEQAALAVVSKNTDYWAIVT